MNRNQGDSLGLFSVMVLHIAKHLYIVSSGATVLLKSAESGKRTYNLKNVKGSSFNYDLQRHILYSQTQNDAAVPLTPFQRYSVVSFYTI
jgi:hypothetical protein